MCAICGCGGMDDPDHAHVHAHSHGHAHHHDHAHAHAHDHHHHDEPGRRVLVEQALLAENSRLAAENRETFRVCGVFALNLVSSPGSGKTTLLERTIRDAHTIAKAFVIQGDQATDRDAVRVRNAGARAVQINTGTGCHLDASMVARAERELRPEPGSVVFIENVGNLVCPALFDLGEEARVAVLSVTEGADKPLKYPYLFRGAGLVLLNKMDLLPYVDFDVDECRAAVRAVNPDARVLPVSAKTGDGMEAWYDFLRSGVVRLRADGRTAEGP